MKREFDFIKNLDKNDIGFVLAQKQEWAVRTIVRGFRRYMAHKRYIDRKQGKKEEEKPEPESELEKKRRLDNEKFYKETEKYLNASNQDPLV